MLATCWLPSVSENCFIRFLSIFCYWPKQVYVFSNLFSVSKLCLPRHSSLEKQQQKKSYKGLFTMTTHISWDFYTNFNRTIWNVPYRMKWQPDTPTIMLMSPWWTLYLSTCQPVIPRDFHLFKAMNNIINQDLTCLDSTSSFCT